MKFTIDYNRCLTNLACSVQRYFELPYKHNSLKEIDEILDKKQPKNVIIMLFDGMGDNILKRTLPEDSFFIKNRIGKITSIFPPTTTAATTTIESGLNPCEHGWLGWTTYLNGINKVVTLFLSQEKGVDITLPELVEAVDKERAYTPIVEQINNAGKYEAHNVSPFGDIKFADFNDLENKLVALTQKPGKKYMYVYNNEPDHMMHDLGPDHQIIYDLIKERNDFVEKLVSKLEDTVVIVIADHGHILAENYWLEDHKDLYQLLERSTSIEPRACSFKVKENCHKQFKELFNKYYGGLVNLLSKEEVLEKKIFGDGTYHEGFVESLGDFIAIAQDKGTCLLDKGDFALTSHHAGLSDDEVYIPLIVVER